jgi:hypothetical protein
MAAISTAIPSRITDLFITMRNGYFYECFIFRFRTMGVIGSLVYWLVSALFAGLFVQRISKSALLGGAAGLGSVTVSAFLANEPGHPVVLLLWMVASYLALPGNAGRTNLQIFLLGVAAAAFALYQDKCRRVLRWSLVCS